MREEAVMFDPIPLQLAQRGVITLPKALRDAYKLHSGDVLTLIDLGGVFVLSPRRSEVDRLADEIAGDLAQRGETLESMLLALREAREGYGRNA
jgi:bifunctional DNA-binding transcriptional regulator/antitoxin component of YhaV-PrlF toxin-antitoxin module